MTCGATSPSSSHARLGPAAVGHSACTLASAAPTWPPCTSSSCAAGWVTG
jgi:hypothetical protein